MPRVTLAMGNATPMTPVDATRISSAAQPSVSPAVRAISRASRRPFSPVQAFAQPLLTTTARATPPERDRCSRETRTGAACARLMVKTAAAVAGVSDTRSARSNPPLALMPALTPEARNPCGVVIPPLATATVMPSGTLPLCPARHRRERRGGDRAQHRARTRGESPERPSRTVHIGGSADSRRNR